VTSLFSQIKFLVVYMEKLTLPFSKTCTFKLISKVSFFSPPKHCCHVNERAKCIKGFPFLAEWCCINATCKLFF